MLQTLHRVQIGLQILLTCYGVLNYLQKRVMFPYSIVYRFHRLLQSLGKPKYLFITYTNYTMCSNLLDQLTSQKMMRIVWYQSLRQGTLTIFIFIFIFIFPFFSFLYFGGLRVRVSVTSLSHDVTKYHTPIT